MGVMDEMSASQARPPRVEAVPLGTQPVRVPDTGGRALLGKSVFDAARGPGAQMSEVRLRGSQAAPAALVERPRVLARPILGQQAQAAPPPPPPPLTEVERVLAREAGTPGLTAKEAGDLARALAAALQVSQAAIANGEHCVGVDDQALSNGRRLADRLAAPAPQGYDFGPDDAQLMERILECASAVQKLDDARSGRAAAYVIGGLVVGGIILVLAT